MDEKLVKINTASGGISVTSFSQFEMFGQTFHITTSRDNENFFTVTHEGTGFCIDCDVETIEDAKVRGINLLKNKGEKKLYKAIRKSKWFLWKQKNVPRLKWIIFLGFYITVGVTSIVGSIIIGLYIGGNVKITF